MKAIWEYSIRHEQCIRNACLAGPAKTLMKNSYIRSCSKDCRAAYILRSLTIFLIDCSRAPVNLRSRNYESTTNSFLLCEHKASYVRFWWYCDVLPVVSRCALTLAGAALRVLYAKAVGVVFYLRLSFFSVDNGDVVTNSISVTVFWKIN